MTRQIHRVLACILFLQVGAWILGGVVFALLPFDGLVKGGASVIPPNDRPLPDEWSSQLWASLGQADMILELSTEHSSQGALLRLRDDTGSHWLRLSDGQLAVPPRAADIERYAASLYIGNGELADIRRVEQVPSRFMGLVDELYGLGDVWIARYDDGPNTRLYFEGATGRYLMVRNDYWVLSDALWRLHIMDYGDGEDFNNWLLRLFALSTLVFVLSGMVLGFFSLRRAIKPLLSRVSR